MSHDTDLTRLDLNFLDIVHSVITADDMIPLSFAQWSNVENKRAEGSDARHGLAPGYIARLLRSADKLLRCIPR